MGPLGVGAALSGVLVTDLVALNFATYSFLRRRDRAQCAARCMFRARSKLDLTMASLCTLSHGCRSRGRNSVGLTLEHTASLDIAGKNANGFCNTCSPACLGPSTTRPTSV